MNGYISTEDKRRELANRFMRIAEGRSDYFGRTQRQLLNEAAMPAAPAPAAPMPADPNMMGGAMPQPPMQGAAPGAMPADPSMMGGAMPQPPMGGAPGAMPADPSMMGGAMPGAMPGAPMPGAMPGAPGAMPQGPSDTNNDGVLDDLNGDGKTDDLTGDGFPNIDDDASDDNPLGGQNNAGGDMNMGNDGGQNKNNELGNNEIANGQEIMNDKVDLVGQNLGHVDDRIAQMFGTINRLINMVDSNNRKIEDLSKEVAKRSPTPTERLNIRSQDGYPFNIPVSDFWKEKARTSNYRAYADNSEPTTNEYRITNSDVDDFSDRDMEASFDVDGEDLNQTINKIFGYH